MSATGLGRGNRVRIIGGVWRGRVVEVVEAGGLRPTSDRVRETLFNWLQGEVAGSRCLDLFAGSGVLGFEALSRGAVGLVQVERDAEVSRQLKLSAEALGCEGVECFTMTAAEWIAAQGGQPERYDIVFLDPPFADDLLSQTCALLDEARLVAASGKVYLESGAPITQDMLPARWRLERHKRAGDVHYGLAVCASSG